jgi:hypothetical protein
MTDKLSFSCLSPSEMCVPTPTINGASTGAFSGAWAGNAAGIVAINPANNANRQLRIGFLRGKLAPLQDILILISPELSLLFPQPLTNIPPKTLADSGHHQSSVDDLAKVEMGKAHIPAPCDYLIISCSSAASAPMMLSKAGDSPITITPVFL